ncbi:MAG: hypothetical protein H6553_11170 [Chitinophagales bacterium]|nr:hypothetical protein [Chitinophagales bacterium]
MKKLILIQSLAFLLFAFCDRNETDSCDYDMCNPNRSTILVAENWTGYLSYYNDLNKWAANIHIQGTIDGIRTCIICSDIPDSLKIIGKTVVISGELKESCDTPTPVLGGQEIYFINPTKLQ